jgi:hypothetical protein
MRADEERVVDDRTRRRTSTSTSAPPPQSESPGRHHRPHPLRPGTPELTASAMTIYTGRWRQ